MACSRTRNVWRVYLENHYVGERKDVWVWHINDSRWCTDLTPQTSVSIFPFRAAEPRLGCFLMTSDCDKPTTLFSASDAMDFHDSTLYKAGVLPLQLEIGWYPQFFLNIQAVDINHHVVSYPGIPNPSRSCRQPPPRRPIHPSTVVPLPFKSRTSSQSWSYTSGQAGSSYASR